MKKSNLFLVAIAAAFVFVSCEPEDETKTTLVDFEDVVLSVDGSWNGSDLKGVAVKEMPSWGGDSITNYYGTFNAGNCNFKNSFIPDPFYPSWNGFACSSKTDTITSGFSNQYSTIAAAGAFNSKQFALAYDSASFICPSNTYGNFNIKSVMLTNSTYAYLYQKNFSEDSWFKVIITGYLNQIQKSKVEYYLSDFRDGKTLLSNTWNKVDLSSLGEVDQVTFTFDSTDKSFGWLNVPAYVCIDNIEFTQTISTK